MKKSRAATSKAAAVARRPGESRLTAGSPHEEKEDAGGTPALLGSAFSELDRHFARFIERLAGAHQPELALAAALASWFRGQGHTCLDLAAVAGQPWPQRPEDGRPAARCPELDAWLRALRAAPAVGAPGEFKPLVLDDRGRLYLHRYWEYETALAREIQRRAADAVGSGRGLAGELPEQELPNPNRPGVRAPRASVYSPMPERGRVESALISTGEPPPARMSSRTSSSFPAGKAPR